MILRRTLIDNPKDTTKGTLMTEVLKECLKDKSIKEAYIATGYWDLRGTELLYEELQEFLSRDGSKLRILIGKDPFLYRDDIRSIGNTSSYDKQENAWRVDLDNFSANEKYVKVVEMLVNNIKDKENEKFQIHIYKPECKEEEQFLHSKCYIFYGVNEEEQREVAYGIIGSSNFTQKGLEGNSELNILEIDPNNITNLNPRFAKDKTHLMWFNEKWKDSKPWEEQFLLLVNQSKMGTVIQPAQNENPQSEELTPYELYIKLLQTKFGDLVDKNLDEVIESYLPNSYERYDYQIDAVKQCFSTMKEHGGFMLADVVGLGKTVVGALIIKHFLQFPDDDGRERKVLIITPPAIQSAWKDTIAVFDKNASDKMETYIDYITTGSIGKLNDGMSVEEDTDDDNNDTGDFEEELKHENYGLILIDESHKFRNSGTAMYAALDNLIAQIGADTGVYPYIGLLSATPQNNRPDDLKNQIYLFERTHNETSLTKANGGNLENFFSEISAEYYAIIHSDEDSPTPPEERNRRLKEISKQIRDCVLTDIMVRRTRTDVQKYYSEDMKRENIKFPQIKGPVSLNYTMDRELSKLFADTIDYISPSEEYKLRSDKYLSYYRYRAIQYLVDENNKRKYDARGSRDADTLAEQLANIMMINLVKRLESSFSAFYQSLLNLRQYTQNMIEMWNSNNVFICPQINVNEELNYKAKEEKRGKKVTFANCVDDIRQKINKLNDEGRNDDERNHEYSRKDFKAEYIDLLNHDYEILCELCDRWAKNTEDPKLDVFKEKLNSELFNSETNTSHKLVIFSEAIDTVETIKRVAENKGYRVLMVTAANRNTLQHVIRENFDANYGKKDGEVQKNDYDVIVTTEVLAEGINLHRANVILNYDTPWNSTRLMQRIGRVNRIGTKQDYVYVYNFKPSDEGDAEIKLVQKAYTKLQSFHTLFGEDNKVYTEEEEVSHYDLNTMVNGEESPLEKYIYELKKFKEENPERYEYILNRDNDLEVATTFIDGCSYFHVKTPRMAGLYVKVDPTNNKGKVISAAEMYQNFAVSKNAPTVSLPEDWEEQKKKAELAVNQHLHKLNVRKAKSNNATKAKEILRKMKGSINMSEKSKSLLDDAFRFVNKGNTDIIKKVLAFDKYVNTSPNDLFGGLSQQDFDDMIEREISNIVSTLQHRYGKAEVFIGLSK